jgi:predicted ATPase
MEGKRLIEKIKLRNILSFGDKGEEIELQPLNIIIGQNASGKSNLVDVIKLLKSLPSNGLFNFISDTGGIGEWLWKGRKSEELAEIGILTKRLSSEYGMDVFGMDLSYFLSFQKNSSNGKIKIISEQIGSEDKLIDRNDHKMLENDLLVSVFSGGVSVISQTVYLRRVFSKIFAYTDLQTNRQSEIRRPQVADALSDVLEEDASNLSLILESLAQIEIIKNKIIVHLKKFNSKISNYTVERVGDYVQLHIEEENLEKSISANRLSDGTLRYLCLLAILCHPEPPPLICIEEPETGLHPDILPTIAELMIEASQRTQLIVTTHSDILVSAFSEIPEAVLVCEKDEDGTHFKRLEKDKLKAWLEEYELGDLWLKGEIGGKRW